MSGTSSFAGDSNVGAGYGTLKKSSLGADSEAEETWPYVVLTDLEDEAKASPDEEELSRKSIRKRSKREVPSDNIGQLNYKPHSFVNGSTRGLTGIMSGVDPRAILEQLINEIKPLKLRRPGKPAGSIVGQKPIGLGAPQLAMMHPNSAKRTRPGQGYGSKLGWFGAPQPKETDPSNYEHRYSLKSIADADEERPIRRADIIKQRNRRKSSVQEGNIALLRSYVQFVSRSP